MAMPIGACSKAVRNRSWTSARTADVPRSAVAFRVRIRPAMTRSPVVPDRGDLDVERWPLTVMMSKVDHRPARAAR